jgi:hypothetical protein
MVMLERLRSFLALTGLPKRWQIAVYASLGICIGMAVLLARIANAASYLSDTLQTCITVSGFIHHWNRCASSVALRIRHSRPGC